MHLKIARLALAGGAFSLALFGGYSLITHFAQSFFQPVPIIDEVASTDADAEGVGEFRSADETQTDASLHAARFTDKPAPYSSVVQEEPEISRAVSESDDLKAEADLSRPEHRALVDQLPPDQFASSPRSVVMSGGSLATSEEDDSVLPGDDGEGSLIGSTVPGISLDVPLPWALLGEISLGLEMPPAVLDLLNLAETSLPDVVNLGLSVDVWEIPAEISLGLDLGDGLIDQPMGVSIALGSEENGMSAAPLPDPLVQSPLPTVGTTVDEEKMASPSKPDGPGQKVKQRRPGMIYGNALGGSVSGLIGGLQAPPEGSVVRYRPEESLAGNGGHGGVPGISQGPIYSSSIAGASALPALAVEVAPLGSVSVGLGGGSASGSSGTALLQGLSGLVSPSGIGINMGGLDLRVNTSISIP